MPACLQKKTPEENFLRKMADTGPKKLAIVVRNECMAAGSQVPPEHQVVSYIWE